MSLFLFGDSPLAGFFVFGMGLIFGSFFNVCIYRLPREESVVKPPSRCPHCSHRITWYENIPILSFVLLRGRCAHCKKGISLEYPVVELCTAAIFVMIFWLDGWTREFFSHLIFFSGLWVASIVDLHHQIIPDEISIGGIPIGFLFALWLGQITWWESVLGIMVGGGSFFAISWVYEKITHRDGLGGGDVKLLAMIGAWLGYQAILPVIVISSALGSVVGIGLMAFRGKGLKEAIPFGPFLAAGAVVRILWGSDILGFLFPVLNLEGIQ